LRGFLLDVSAPELTADCRLAAAMDVNILLVFWGWKARKNPGIGLVCAAIATKIMEKRPRAIIRRWTGVRNGDARAGGLTASLDPSRKRRELETEGGDWDLLLLVN